MGRKYRTTIIISPPIGLMIAIFLFSSIPGRSTGSGLAFLAGIEPKLQNLLHIPLFGLLQVLWLRALTKLGRSGWHHILVCMSISLLYGLFDELHQMFVPGRYASLMDVFFNFIGVFLGTLIFMVWQKSDLQKSIT